MHDLSLSHTSPSSLLSHHSGCTDTHNRASSKQDKKISVTEKEKCESQERNNTIFHTTTAQNSYTLKDRKFLIKDSPRKGDWRRPFHIAGPSCNPRPSCSAAILGGIWRRGPGKTPHTSSPGHSALWMFAAPLSCESQMQTAAVYTQTLHWSDGTQKWMVACLVYCPKTDYAGTESHLCLNVSLWKLNEL